MLVDLAQRRAIAAVDRFAMRQLCFRAKDGVVSFASRADEVPGADDDIDPQAIFDYAYHHFIPAPRTIFKGVSPPRRRASGRRDRGDASAWSATGSRASRSSTLPFAERKEAFLSALTAAVSDQLAGESIGCYLSGGTDSSTVAGMVSARHAASR